MRSHFKRKKEPCSRCLAKPKKWYKNRLLIVAFITFIFLLFSYFIPFLHPFFDAFFDYFKIIWWAVLLGLFIGGLIDYFVPSEYIAKYLSSGKKKSVGYAVVLGFLMSACSHGILAIAIQLYKKGASVSSVIAFLLAAPWANFTITVMLIAFFGLKALFIIFSAILIAIITGLIYQVLEKKGWIEPHKFSVKVKDDFSIFKDIKKRYKRYKFNLKETTQGILKGFWSLANMVLWWIMIGIILAGLVRAFVPTHIFQDYFSASLLGLLATLAVATLIEVCSEGSSPVAFEIFKQTGAFGNSFVFLMAGVVTDYTEIGLLWSNIGKKAALWLPIITVPQVVLLGYLFNILF